MSPQPPPSFSSSSSSSPLAARSAPKAGTVHALSCVNCRQRKVRCSKTYPCPHCTRSGLECVFPSRKKSRAPRRNNNHELLHRLARLEAIVVGQADQDLPPGAAGAVGSSLSSSSSTCIRPDVAPAPAQPVSRGDPAAKYVSGEFWANLSSEVEGIKAALEQPSDDDDNDDEEEDGDGGHNETSSAASMAARGRRGNPNHHVTSHAIFGNVQAAGAGEGLLLHPAPEKMRRLCETYFRNVDPLIKILHRPTVEEMFNGFTSSPVDNPLSRTAEALFFAMYFAAVTSLQPERCKELLGEDRGQLAVRYRQAAEYALARADYLNSTSLETLQALTLYSTCLRNHAESRASWALLALVLRLSQAIGIHRDGDGLAFSPYEAEMRRRLWSQVIVLDVRAATDRGTEPMVRQDEYNTLPPTNLDDSDFGPHSAVPLPRLAREGTTDVTFCLCTYECSNLFLSIHGPRSRFSKSWDHDTTTTNAAAAPRSPAQPQMSEDDLVRRVKELEARFIPAAGADDNAPARLGFQSTLATLVIRIASLTYWLSVQYPWQARQPVARPRVTREHMLQTAVSIMELKALSFGGGAGSDYGERFAWWQDGYTQWHALAVCLAELCVQTEGALVERAWAVVDRAAPVFGDKVADARRGALWRPIRKLLRKARERRAEAQARRLRIDGGGQGAAAPASGQGPAQAAQTSRHRQRVGGGSAVQSQPQPHSQPHSPRPTNPTGATARPPSSPATETGPTGWMFPLAQDSGELSDMGGGAWTAAATITATANPPPPAFILANDHNNRWAIDFGDLGTTPVGAPVDGAQDLDMMDWSHWNEFVNDANVSFDHDHTSPSSEGI